MRKIPMFLLITALLGACSGNSQGPGGAAAPQGEAVTPVPKRAVGEVLARVGDGVVGSEEFQHEAARRQPASGTELTDAERLEVLDELITEEVLFQEAMQRGLYQDSKVRKILVNLLLREQVYAGVKNDDFTEDELKAYYEEHKDEFVVPEKVQVKRIFIRVGPERDDAAAKALAEKVHADLMKDRRLFSELAATHSDGPYKRRGGDIGFISRDGKPGIDDAVVARAFEMKVDEIAAPFEAGDGYHILYVVNRRDRVERTFEQMKGSVVRMVKQDRYKQLTDDYIAKAKSAYRIEIDEAKVKAVDIGRGGARFASPAIDPEVEAPGDEMHP